MKKQEYQKLTMQVVRLQHQHQLLAESLTRTSTNLEPEDDLEIDDTPRTTIWGR